MGVDEENIQVMDVEMAMENCQIIIFLRYILTSSKLACTN